MRRLLPALAVLTALFAFSLTAAAQQIKQVEVINFPDPQNVTGAVGVINFPDPQNVVGFVEVTNFPAPATPSRFQLVGFTTTTHPGATGALAFTLSCQQDYPGSRMCSSAEVLNTVDVPQGLSGVAWVRPAFVPTGSVAAMDLSGLFDAPNDFTCKGWSSAVTGLTVNENGSFSILACSSAQHVACCAPVP